MDASWFLVYLIKTKNPDTFNGVDAKELTLWRVSIQDDDNDGDDDDDDDVPILLATLSKKKKLRPTTELSDVFKEGAPKKTIHIIVQQPSPVHAPVPARSLTPLPGQLSDESRPGTPLSGDLRVDIKKITDKFFAPGTPVANFLDSFVRGHGALPVTEGSIRGLPRAWRRAFGKPAKTRPSLLFLDLPDPSTPDSASSNLASTSIMDMVKENNRQLIPVFGVSYVCGNLESTSAIKLFLIRISWCSYSCGKTRAVIELLSQHWGFYFNASSDDWGSGDMITLHSTVQKHLNDTRGSFIVDRQANNAYARKTTLLLFLSRLLIFKHCLNASGSSKTFTSARWTLLQVCPHVLFEDIFETLFIELLKLLHHRESYLSEFVRDVYEDAKYCLLKHGCLPKIKDDTRLLVVHDEAQFLGDEFNGDFQSMSSSDESPRPLLSPILHAFRDIAGHQLTLVTCGTGLSINTLYWVQSSGSGLKDSSSTFDYMEFAGWTGQESIKAYISRLRRCLPDDDSRRALDERFLQEAIDMLLERLAGRFRPALVAVEKIIEGNGQRAWQVAIEDTEDKLASWAHRDIKGNLCNELLRLHDKCNKHSDQLVDSVESILGLLLYQRCMFGEDKLVLNQAEPQLVERAFGRIKIESGHVMTVLNEPFVMKAVENYFFTVDPYFRKATRRRMQLSNSASDHGFIFESFMMSVFSETFNTRPLSEWPHQPPISEMCAALVGKVEIVGWKEPGLEQGTTHKNMSMEEFMDAHVNQQSTWNNKAIAPFYFPKSKPSGPDMVFFIRIQGKLFPVFAQLKLHQKSTNFTPEEWKDAYSTVSAPKIESHAKDFRKYCPEKAYISMIVAYPTKWTSKLPARPDVALDASGVQQVVINVSDNNFGEIFPKDHVEFIDRLKNTGKRSVGDVDGDDDDRSKKQKS
ncbi:hypothetical protein EDD21DRAFT_425759 [Dissophora ornata]|nr:hypothetical protein EDD21DRAFT_425759 [Dissophora ornata]